MQCLNYFDFDGNYAGHEIRSNAVLMPEINHYLDIQVKNSFPVTNQYL